jgi:hypothetical protein
MDRLEAERLVPQPSLSKAQQGLEKKLSELEEVLSTDEVDADAIYLSLRRELALLRKSSKGDIHRSFGFGLLHDALLFTRLKQITQGSIQGLRAAIGLALKADISEETLDQIEDLLQAVGFDLVPGE